MSPRPEPRIGDAERDAAVRALGEHYAAGRITKDEFDERSNLAMQARTDADLRPLFSDLPRLGSGTGSGLPSGARVLSSRHDRRAPAPSWWQAVPLVPLVIGLVALVVVTKMWWLLFVVWLVFICRPGRRPGRR
jgi:hypothetical protein